MKNITRSVLLLTLLIGLLACSMPEEDKDYPYASIDGVYWIIQNIDNGFWTDGSTGPCLFYYFSLQISNTDVSLSDIESLTIVDPNDLYWTLAPSQLSQAGTSIYLPRLYDGYSRSDGGILAIGDHDFILRYKDGETATYTLNIPSPNSTTTDGYDYVYCPDHGINSAPSNYVAMISCATSLSNGILTSSELRLDFRINEPRTYSGYLHFFDDEGAWIGESDPFRDPVTENITSLLDGGIFVIDGSANNTVVLSPSDVELSDGSLFTDIYSASVVITDGDQYSDNSSYLYDCESFSDQYYF